VGEGGTTALRAVTGPRATAVVARAVDPGVVDAMRRAITADDPLGELLAAATASGLRRLPDFAFVVPEAGGVRVVVRGDVRVDVHRGGTAERLDGSDVATWTERRFDGPVEVVVAIADAQLVVVPDGTGVAPQASPVPVALHEPEMAAAATAAPQPPPLPPTVEPPPESEETFAGVVAADDDFDSANIFETRYTNVEAAAVRDDVTESVPMVEVPPLESSPIAAPPTDSATWAPPSVEPEQPPLIVSVPHAPAADPPPARGQPQVAGDHDGMTISAADLAAARDRVTATGPVVGAAAGPTVQAVSCALGHLSPPHAAVCRTCARAIDDRTIRTVARPSLGRLRFDSGMVVEIDRPLLIGRKPSADNRPGEELPALVTLPDPDAQLSRVHAELRIEGWDVLVVDRESKNGTLVTLPNETPVMLRPLTPFLVSPGARLSFAEVADCTFEVDG